MHITSFFESKSSVRPGSKEDIKAGIIGSVRTIVEFFPSLNVVWGKKVEEIADTIAYLIANEGKEVSKKDFLGKFTQTTGPDFDVHGGKIQHRAEILYDEKTKVFSISPFIYNVKLVIYLDRDMIVATFETRDDLADDHGNVFVQEGARLRENFERHLKSAA